MVTAPPYAPGDGWLPLTRTVTVDVCPASSCKLEGERESCARASAPRGATARLNEAALPLVLVTLRAMLSGRLPGPISPMESAAGSTVAPTGAAAPTFNLPAPTAVTRARPLSSFTSSAAVFTTADFNCATLKPGCCCLTSATAPATMAAEKLVPCAAV